MKLKDKLFGISTKDLEVVELMRCLKDNSLKTYDITSFRDVSYTSFNPPIYLLAKRLDNNNKLIYKDAFSNRTYESVDNDFCFGNILAKQVLSEITFHKKRVKYTDAQNYINEMNSEISLNKNNFNLKNLKKDK